MSAAQVPYAVTQMQRGGYRAECHHTYPHGGLCEWFTDAVDRDVAFKELRKHMMSVHRVERVTLRKALTDGHRGRT